MAVKYEIVKTKTLTGEVITIVKKEVEGEEEHIRDNTRCMHAKGLKCRCKCHSVYHGWVWKRKNEKLDKFLEDETVQKTLAGLNPTLNRG